MPILSIALVFVLKRNNSAPLVMLGSIVTLFTLSFAYWSVSLQNFWSLSCENCKYDISKCPEICEKSMWLFQYQYNLPVAVIIIGNERIYVTINS